MSKNHSLAAFVVAALTLIFAGGAAAQSLTVGSGTFSQTSMAPVYRQSATSTLDYSRFYVLYNQSDLAGLPAGATITDLEFFLVSGDTEVGASANFNLYLRNTTASNYTSSQTWDTTGATLVYSNSAQTITAPNDYMSFGTWATNFTYQGGGIEVLVEWDISGFTTGNPTTAGFSWQYSSRSGGSSTDSQIAGGGSSSALPTTLFTSSSVAYSRLPNARFTYTPNDALLVSGTGFQSLAALGGVDEPVSQFELMAQNTSTQDISGIVLTYTGTIAAGNVTNFKLWDDANGDGQVSTGEAQLGSTVAALSGNSATFNFAPALSVTTTSAQTILVTADVSAGATANNSVSFEVNSASDVTTSPGTVVGVYPVDGGSAVIVSYASTFPFTEDFDGTGLASNIRITSAAGTYPTSTGVGATPGSGALTSDATVQVTGTTSGVTPLSGANMLNMEFATGGAVGGLEARFDLSAFNAGSDKIELRFAWYDDGIDTTSTYTPFNYIFISTDGGSTWLTTLYDFDESQPSGWFPEILDVSAAVDGAGANFTSTMVIRFQLADNSTFDLANFDDIVLRDIPPALVVDASAPTAGGAFGLSASNDLIVLDAHLRAEGNHQTVSDITVSNAGTMADADISEVKLWLDNNDSGTLDAADVQIGGTQTFSGGSATFSTLNLSVNLGGPRDLLVTYSFAAGATGSVGCEISSAGDISNTPDPVVSEFGQTFPLGGVLGQVASATSSLPYLEDFDGAGVATNIAATSVAGSYPTAVAVGGATGSATSGADSSVTVEGTFSGVTPNSGTSQAAFSFPNGQATGALDFLFDLSAYNANSDDIMFRFAWNDDFMDGGTVNHSFSHVFVSNDGGQSWITSVFFIDQTIANNVWTVSEVNISTLLSAASVNYTNNMVIRIQTAEGGSFDNLLVDDVELEFIAPAAPTVGDPMASGGAGQVMITEFAEDPGASGNEFIEITNVGGSPVDITGWQMYVWTNGNTTSFSHNVTVGSVVLAAGQTFLFADVTNDATFTVGAYLGSNILDFDDAGGLLLDSSSAVVDAAFVGAINPALISNPVTIGSEWTGAAASAAFFNGPSAVRTGTSDNNDASDWTGSTNPPNNDSIGAANSGLTLPWATAGGNSLSISGTNPTFTATVDLGGDLDFQVSADDVNSNDTLTFTVTVTGGSLTAAQAGFSQAFAGGVYNDPNPNQAAPHSVALGGIAAQLGTIDLQISCSDGTLSSNITLSITIQAGSPIVRATPDTLPAMNAYGFGVPSIEEVLTVQGYSLTNDIVVTAPAQFEVSTTSGGGFGPSVTLIPTGGSVAATSIFVRYNPMVSGPHSGAVSADSTGASSASASVSGFILPEIPPVLGAPVTPTPSGAVLITEMVQDPGSSGDEFVELTNVSNAPVDISGWNIKLFTAATPYIDYTMTGAVLQPGETYVLTDSASATPYVPSEYWGQNAGSLNNHAFMLSDASGSPVDVVVCGNYSIAGNPTLAANWTGPNAPDVPFDDSVVRSGTQDNDDTTNFAVTTGDNLGIANTGLTLPFPTGQTFLTVSGSAPNFMISGFVGDSLDIALAAEDFNVQETLTFTVTETGGTLTAATLGFNQVFTGGVYNDPAPARSPHELILDGTAVATGTLDLQVSVSDGQLVQTLNLSITITNPPSMTVTGTPLSVMITQSAGTPSPEQSFTVEGTDLQGDIEVTAPVDFEISLTSGGTFGPSITLVPAGGSVAPTQVFVRYNPAAGPSTAANLTVESPSVTTAEVALWGVVGNNPVINTLGTPLAPFVAPALGMPSTEQSFTVLVANPVGVIDIVAPADFEVSLSTGTGFAPSLSVSPPNGASQFAIVVFIRYTPPGPATSTMGSVSITSSGATSVTVVVDGSVTGTGGTGGGGGGSGGGGGGGDGGGGCVTSTSNGMWGLLLGMAAMLVIALRVRAVRENHA